jgi:hypothetical protein
MGMQPRHQHGIRLPKPRRNDHESG